jgi:single-stranded-DNA-specific exonuclease
VKKWQIAKRHQHCFKLAEELNITRLAARLLTNRGLFNREEIDTYLFPKFSSSHDPFEIPDLGIGVDRIIEELKTGKPIGILGDYDVDGLLSIVILKDFLEKLNTRTVHYVPNRFNEGYGLSRDGIDFLAERGVSLIITVDCGATAIKEVEYAKTLGIDVIVTDHHELDDILPPAVALIDPKRKDSKFPFKELAGVGVVYKLVQGIATRLQMILEEDEFLDFVAVGTIADIVPIVDENRIFVKYGLNRLNRFEHMGLKTLITTTGLGRRKLDTTQISFILAPRINACGRLGHAEPVLDLFFTEDEAFALQVAEQLNHDNQKRKEIENHILAEAIEQIKETPNLSKGIVIAKRNWHRGVIGLVASKLVEIYSKPVIVISIENGIAYGSGRSYGEFDIYSALKDCASYLISYGGHKYAVGLSLKTEKIPSFTEAFLDNLSRNLIPKAEINTIMIDEELSFKQISQNLTGFLLQMAPFGVGNPKPVFLTRCVEIINPISLQVKNQFRFRLREANTIVNAVAYRFKSKYDFNSEKYFDVIYNIETQEFKGKLSFYLNIIDMLPNDEYEPDA